METRQLLEYSDEAIFVSRLSDGRLIDVNAAFVEHLGYTREEAIGRSPLELNLWEDPSVHEGIRRELSATGSVRHWTVEFLPRDGSVRSGLLSAVIRQFDGESRCVSFITDITEKLRREEELRQSEQRFRSYIENAYDGFTVFDEEGRITFVAPSVRRLLGVPSEKIVGRNFREFVHPEDLKIAEDAVDIFGSGAPGSLVTFRVKHRDGHWVFIEGAPTELPPFDNGPPQMVLNWRDITQRKRDEERLRATEKRLRDIIGHAPIVVTEFDKHGILTMVEGNGVGNAENAKRIGHSMYERFARSPEITSALDRVLRGEAAQICADVDGKWFDIWTEPVLCKDGSVAGGIAVSTDVTDRILTERELQDEREQLRILLDNASDIILLVDRDEVIEFVSPSVEAHSGYRVDEIIGRNGLEFADPDDRAAMRKCAEAAFSNPGSIFSVRFQVRSKSGERRRLEARVKVAPSKPDRMIVLARDITAQEEYETQLARARDAALESSRLKGAFLANISHEIRTPLNVMMGYLSIIAEHLAETGDDSQREYMEAAALAGHRLTRTISGILDYSRIEAGRFECSRKVFKLSDLIKRHVTEFRLLAQRKRIQFSLIDHAPDARIVADEYCVSSAMQNLVGNAIKFTENGSVTLRQYLSEGEVSLEVSDTGIGIDESFLPRLFQPFVQEDAGFKRQFEGSGLGLALTKRFVEANGGRITVRSTKGEGSVFTIHFAAASPPEFERTLNGSTRNGATPSLLLVEDDPDTQLMMQKLLQSEFDLKLAASGEEVRKAIAGPARAFVGVLMDISLKGGEDGVELTRFLRTLDRFHDTPIIALTAHDSADQQHLAMSAGCDLVLTKPVRRAQIVAALQWAKLKRASNDNRETISLQR